MTLTNIILTLGVIILAGGGIAYFVKRNKNQGEATRKTVSRNS